MLLRVRPTMMRSASIGGEGARVHHPVVVEDNAGMLRPLDRHHESLILEQPQPSSVRGHHIVVEVGGIAQTPRLISE